MFIKFWERIKSLDWNLIYKSLLGLILTGIIFYIIILILQTFGITTEKIQNFANQFGPFSFFILLILMMLSVMSPLPDTPVALAGIIIYGPFLGFLINYFGTVLGAIADFYIARRLGKKFFEKRFPKLLEKTNNFTGKFGIELIVFLRIFPAVSFDIASYISAMTKVRAKIFILATMIGAFAPAVSYVFLGLGVTSNDNTKLILFYGAGYIFMISTVLITNFFAKKKGFKVIDDIEI